MSEDGEQTDRPPVAADAAGTLDVEPGEQVLVSLGGEKFDYGRFPETAFENLLVLSVGRNPRQIERALDPLDVNPRSVGVVPVTGSSISYDGPMWTSNRVSPMDLTGISIEFTRGFEHLHEGRGWVLVDSVSILLMYADVDRLYRLLDSMVTACRQKQVRGVFVVDADAVASETMSRLEGLFDRVVTP
jgi:hypothetical protein